MPKQVIEVTKTGTKIRFSNELIVLETPDMPIWSTPAEEVGALLLTQSRVSVTGVVLAELAQRGIPLIGCNERFLPVGAYLPFTSNARQTCFFIEQAKAPQPLQKKLWKQIVQAKIRSQAEFLKYNHFEAADLLAMGQKVRSGDPQNYEGAAARIYWQRLPLIEQRERQAEDANRLLNYAYTVLFALSARAVCIAGLHPSLGIYHHNIYNPYCLASDLMESYRTAADEAALLWYQTTGQSELSRGARQYLAQSVLKSTFQLQESTLDIFSALSQTAISLRECYQKTATSLTLPHCLPGQIMPPQEGAC